jgi:protein translocase SecG subunit
MNETLLNSVQIALGAILSAAVLLQNKGSSLGGAFGGSSNVYSTKRGVDKVLHYTTIITSILFFGFSLGRLFIR